jgi:hypothetical protein
MSLRDTADAVNRERESALRDAETAEARASNRAAVKKIASETQYSLGRLSAVAANGAYQFTVMRSWHTSKCGIMQAYVAAYDVPDSAQGAKLVYEDHTTLFLGLGSFLNCTVKWEW